MEEYISQITVLKDALAATGEHLKETYIILIALGGPSMEYESFVTTITQGSTILCHFPLCVSCFWIKMRIHKSSLDQTSAMVNVVVK